MASRTQRSILTDSALIVQTDCYQRKCPLNATDFALIVKARTCRRETWVPGNNHSNLKHTQNSKMTK